VSEGGGILRGRPWLRAWLVVGLAAWATIGVLLVSRANSQGLVEDITFSPYHVVGYAALLVLGGYVVWTFFRAFRHGQWRAAFPPLYGSLGLAFVLIVAWVVLDPIWQSTLEIRGIEGSLAPTRLLIPVALVLLAIGPLREAIAQREEPGLRPGELRVRWAGVVAAGLVAAAITAPAFNPVIAPLSDWAYLQAADRSEIWTMNADGTAQTRLLTAAGDGTDYSLPAWSPDGTRIAYTAWSNKGGTPQNARAEDQTAAIWTMAVDGSDRRMVFDGATASPGEADAWIPAWSPDGRWLTFTLSPKSQPATGAAEPQANVAPGQVGPPSLVQGSSVWIVRPDGTEARRLSSEQVDAIGATWAPDGQRIAFVASAPGMVAKIHVATVSPSGLADEAVVSGDRGDDWSPAWSPDGRQVAYASDSSGNDEIWVATLGGGLSGIRQLTDDTAGDWVPAFSPDGSQIVFVSDRTGEPEIWSMAADGSDPRNLTDHPQHFDGNWSVSWAPDGSRLAYGNASFQDPVNSGWVREDFAAAQALLFGVALAFLALLLVALGAPVGSFALAVTIVVAAAAVVSDEWRFVPWAIAGGLIVDGLLRLVRLRWRARLAAAALPAITLLALAIPIGSAGTMWWSITLLAGVALTTGVIGWGIAEAVGRLLPGTRAGTVPVDA
jgi:Tol biopolymer transport system component